MAELLHYLDKMEYRPTPKPQAQITLKRRPDQEGDDHVILVDKRNKSGFKRVVIKEFERIVGAVQERKKQKLEQDENPQIYLEVTTDIVTEEFYTPAVAVQDQVESVYEEERMPFAQPKVPVAPPVAQPKEPLAQPKVLEPKEPLAQPKEPLAQLEVPVAQPLAPLEEQEEAPLEEQENALELNEPLAQPKAPEPKVPKLKAPLESVVPPTKKKPAKTTKKNLEKVDKRNQPGLTETIANINGARVPKQKDLSELVIRAPAYYMSNRKLYTQQLAALFQHFSKELLDDKTPVSCDRQGSTTNIDLLIHQRIVREYLNLYTPYRGLLLYHGLGSGKTCTSIAIAEAAKTHKRVFIMTPASLKTNFFSELKKCGDALYKKNQYWEFISIEGRPEYVAALSQILAISSKTILKNGGAWLVDITKTEPNFAELSPENQKILDEQLDEMIRAKYVDVNYNGLNERKFKELVKTYGDSITKNPFDHSVVLVDEAHNLVSRILNNLKKPNTVTSKLYEYLQSAQDVRVVFMSGTPIINYPHEMGVMFNILRGYIKTWKFTVNAAGNTKLSSDSIMKMFRAANFQTFDYIDYSNDTLTITRNPFGFVNISGNAQPPASGVQVPKTVVQRGNVIKPPAALLPLEEEEEDAPLKKTTTVAAKENKTKKVAFKEPSKRVTKRNMPKIEDEVVEMKPHKQVKGALLLEPDKEIDLADAIRQDIAEEVRLERNAAGEDTYHSGGAIIVDNKYKGVRLDEQGNLSDVDFEHRIKQILTDNDITVLPKVIMTKNKCLPDVQKEFQDIFIDMDSLTLQRPDVLKKRMLGLTSYFRSAQESLLPQFVLSKNTLNPNFHIEYVEMSDHQLNDYAAERAAELKRERKPKNKAKENEEILKTSGSYRTFTRAKCNFSFPDEIPRPTPPNMFDDKRDLRAEDLDNIRDDNELDSKNDDDEPEIVKKGEYERQIQHALDELKTNADKYLTPEALQKYSPKFAKILSNVQDRENKGLHLLYSSFRTLEGIGILKLVLEANGFAEFKLKKDGDAWTIREYDNAEDANKPKFVLYTGTETTEEKEIIRNIYNSNWEIVPGNITAKLREIHANNYYGEIIRMIMITSSGAEGINLENTRFVHIVEPYWHMVRIDQVVGRARRICSHKNLPEELRTIKVFLYMSKFSDKQKTDGKNVGIMINDVSRINTPPAGAKTGEYAITTDETLFEIAVIKDRLTKQLLKTVKESSVDCNIYDNSKEGLVCYSYGVAKSKEFGTFPTYEEDRYVREGTDVATKVVEIKAITIDGKKYARNMETDELYDYDTYKKSKKAVLVGKVVMVNGKANFRDS